MSELSKSSEKSLPNKLKTTALYNLHQRLGAKLVAFAGYEMPVQYPLGVLKEHIHTRTAAGLFDVSHMGQIRLSGDGVAQALETIVPVDIVDLPIGQQRYALFTNDQGGILDDLMISNCSDHFILVVNAACKIEDTAYLKASLGDHINIETLDNKALLALQGPKSREVLSRLCDEPVELVFMRTATLNIKGIECFVSCSGYTGEDGFEISVDNTHASALAEIFLAESEVEAIGLGARDSLRLEAGLCLYGHDIDRQTTPIEANLLWSISKVRRPGELRGGGYPGASTIAKQIQEGTHKKRLMLKPAGRAPVREGTEIADAAGNTVGIVTSGGFGPTIEGPVVMAYIDTEIIESGADLFALVRKKALPLTIVSKNLLPSRYYRG